MNLRLRHFPIILLGAAIGAVVGRILASLLAPEILPDFQKALGQPNTGVVLGALVAAALTVLILLFRSIRDPIAESPSNFTSINGIGSTLIGKTDIAPDRSYLTTEWFIILFIPIFPVCTYRVTERGRQSYTIHSKQPPAITQALKIYLIELTLAAILIALYLLHSPPAGCIALATAFVAIIIKTVHDRIAARKSGVIYTRNFCRACGYSLVGNTSNICPECGTPKPT